MASVSGNDAARVLRVLALIAVAVGLAALTAAACVLSYSSVHHLALQAGADGRLAAIYPLIFDAILVVAGCSVLALRGAGLVSRLYSWLCLLLLLAALAAGGVLHAATVKIPHKLAAVVAAIVPWALVLIGFGLLVALLRYARLRRLGKRNGRTAFAVVSRPAEVVPTVIASAVPEREPEAIASERPLIPGLPPRPQAVTVPVLPENSPAEGTDQEGEIPAQETPEVRRAEMRLRARSPKQAAQDTARVSVASPGWPTPFMPKFGQQAAPATRDDAGPPDGSPQHSDTAPAGDEAQQDDDASHAGAGSSQDQPSAEETVPAEILPKRVPGQQPVIHGFDPQGAEPQAAQAADTEPATTADSDDAGSTSTFNAAPELSEDDDEAGGLPAFRRTRSSPTPPQEDQKRS